MNLIVKTEIRTNGKPLIKLSKDINGTVGRFNVEKINLFIIEQKVNNRNTPKRQFIVSIRMDGAYKNKGEHKLTQISLTESELHELKNQIENVLSFG